jgi:hypothetical protein
LIEVFAHIPHFMQADAEILLQMGRNRLLSDAFQFIIHLSHHSAL